ncbi:MAG: AraC family transcriptional regulator [Clostridiaceae bacterium]|nr:AraC family transcriptional regulator [Eubacteriales bacterium]
MDWLKSVNGAIAYMEGNLTGKLAPEDVAAQVYLSCGHFQRAFSVLTGMTVGEYIRNRRLSLAGQELAVHGARVIDVALKYGYETPESFAKAFYRFHGVTPSQVKLYGAAFKSFNRLAIKIKLEGGTAMDYKVIKKDAFPVAVKRRLFNMESSGKEIPLFWDEYMREGLHEKVCGMYGVCEHMEENGSDFYYDIGADWPEHKPVPEGFTRLVIPAAAWAVFRCVGAMPHAIQRLWETIYGEWAPQADYELLPGYEIELYTEGDPQRDDYVSEIWLPVKAK